MDRENLGTSVADALLARPISPLPPTGRFTGAGIYAIYYVGDYPAYVPVAERNRDGRFELPIYVGRAIPEGARKGGFGLGIAPGPVLFRRLTEHAGSVNQAENLDLSHFYCRYLVVDDIWIPLGENLLIERFTPVWNKVVSGFGNKHPGERRLTGQKPLWDMLHPGRPWADLMPNNSKSRERILAEVYSHLSEN